MIYLDYNATAPVRPEVKEAIVACYDDPLNPSSVHAMGRKAKRLLEEARESVAKAVSCFPNEVIFTASGTEANNMALRGFGDRPLLIGATEHSSNKVTAGRVGGDTLPVDSSGLIDLDVMESKLKALGKPAIVSVMLVNNETGIIQPIKTIAELAQRYGALIHTDAVQMLGKGPIDIGLLGVDMLTISGHKMGGPVGAAALVIRNDLPIKPLIFGGNQELGRRASTENVTLAAGFAKAIEIAENDDWIDPIKAKIQSVKERLSQQVPSIIYAGEKVNRLPHVINMMTPGTNSETQLMHLDLAGICASAGSACSSGRITPSHVLKAMGYADAIAGCAIRISVGWATKAEDLDQFADSWLEMAERLRKKAA